MPSSSLFLGSSTTLVSALALLSAPVVAQTSYYKLDTEWAGDTFFDNWNFYNDADPTHGFVTYVNKDTAQRDGLIQTSFDGNNAYMGVDYTNVYDPDAPTWNTNGNGRPSVRIESQKSWTHGLFIAKVDHMPGGICGTWPAFWTTVTSGWPVGGEIDIVEGANLNTRNMAVLHDAGTCKVAGDSRLMTGQLQSSDCEYYPFAADGNNNPAGCGITDDDTSSYGQPASNVLYPGNWQPQVFAMEWTSDAIKVWSFPADQAPTDLEDEPDTSTWGLPAQTFSGSNDCNIDQNFYDQKIILDTTFCGDYAGNQYVWGTDITQAGTCAAKTLTTSCNQYVAENPYAFQDAYWSIEYIRVFQKALKPATTTTTTTTMTTTTAIQTTLTTTTTSATVSPLSTSPITNDVFPAINAGGLVDAQSTITTTTTGGLVDAQSTIATTTTGGLVDAQSTVTTTIAIAAATTTSDANVLPGQFMASSTTIVNAQPATTIAVGGNNWADWDSVQGTSTTAGPLTPTQLTTAICQSSFFAPPAGGCDKCTAGPLPGGGWIATPGGVGPQVAPTGKPVSPVAPTGPGSAGPNAPTASAPAGLTGGWSPSGAPVSPGSGNGSVSGSGNVYASGQNSGYASSGVSPTTSWNAWTGAANSTGPAIATYTGAGHTISFNGIAILAAMVIAMTF